MQVFDLSGVKIGSVVRVDKYPANDVIIIGMEEKDIMIPAVKEFVKEIDINENRMIVEIPEGLPVYPKGKI